MLQQIKSWKDCNTQGFFTSVILKGIQHLDDGKIATERPPTSERQTKIVIIQESCPTAFSPKLYYEPL